MNVKEIRARVETIREAAWGDEEEAHFLEDDLWESVLHHIALDGRNASTLAKEALKTKDIEFGRW
jgi:hypothetical protein